MAAEINTKQRDKIKMTMVDNKRRSNLDFFARNLSLLQGGFISSMIRQNALCLLH